MQPQIESLVALGFTNLEAEIYAFLVTEPAATGYRIAQAISKPAANTYKALESLQAKGGVLVDDDEVRRFRAVPSAELLNHLERRFKQNRRRAEKALSRSKRPTVDDRLYQVGTYDQVLERARTMLSNCADIVVVDAAPQILDELRQTLEMAADRGVEVIVKAYRRADINGARVILRPNGNEITDALPGDLLSLNVDGSQHLLALLGRDGESVFQAVWTRSPVVAYLLFTGLINEISLTAVMTELNGRPSVKSIRSAVSDLRQFHPISSRGPAYKNLLQHIGASGDSSNPKAAVKTRRRGKRTLKSK